MHKYVEELKYAVPPHTSPIDIDKPDWLRHCLSTMVQGLVGLTGDKTSPSATTYRDIIESVVFLVVNYDSKSDPGIIGGRHTLTLINETAFLPHDEDITANHADVREQNHIEFFGAPPATEAVDRAAIERFWFHRWKKYFGWVAGPTQFTLNDVLLRVASSPRPVFLSWFDSTEHVSEQPTTLTPLALNFAPVAAAGAPETAFDPPDGTALDAFTAQFQRMFLEHYKTGLAPTTPIEITPESVDRMCRRLVDHFADLGAQCFFSIPVSIRVSAEGTVDTDLRAVISVAVRRPWNPSFYGAAWSFFTGVANRVLADILVSEYAAFTRKRWELSTANAVYLAGHPLKHRLQAVDLYASELHSDLREARKTLSKPDLVHASFAPLRTSINLMHAKADRLMSNVEAASAYANFMNLLADLLDTEAADRAVRECAEKNREAAHRSPEWIDFGAELVEAASIARDSKTGDRTILIDGEPPSHFIPSRFYGGALDHHCDKEHLAYRTIFLELLRNAVNYGLSDSGSDKDPVVVQLGVRRAHGELHFILENAVHPDFVASAEEALARRNDRNDPWRQASGMTVVDDLLKRLRLGSLHCTSHDIYGRWLGAQPGARIWKNYLIIMEHWHADK